MKPPEQIYFDGMQPPDEQSIPAIAEELYAWLDAKEEQKRAGDTVKTRHYKLLELMAEYKLDSYAYTCPSSGKRRRVWVAKEPKARTTAVPKPKAEKAPKKRQRANGGVSEQTSDPHADSLSEQWHRKTPVKEDRVEMRRVPRASVEKEIDPFAATRAALEGAPAHANGVNPALLGGKKSKGKKGKRA